MNKGGKSCPGRHRGEGENVILPSDVNRRAKGLIKTLGKKPTETGRSRLTTRLVRRSKIDRIYGEV